MPGGGRRADHQLVGDLPVGQALGGEAGRIENLEAAVEIGGEDLVAAVADGGGVDRAGQRSPG